MRKLLVSLALVVVMAFGAAVGPARLAVAAPAGQANCVAETISTVIGAFGGRSLATVVVLDAQEEGAEGAGEFIAPRASTNTCT